MKARVKATGEIVEVDLPFISASKEIVYERVGSVQVYAQDELDFDVQGENIIDYWEKLKHQYAGMAMQGILNNPIGFENIRVRGTNIQIETALLASEFAHALVEKMKEAK
jgi:hypothetical protein